MHWAYHDWAAKRGAMDFWAAVSGLEQALWDIAGKRHGAPVHALLGGRSGSGCGSTPTAGTAGSKTPADYAARARETVRARFTALKFDPFPGPVAQRT